MAHITVKGVSQATPSIPTLTAWTDYRMLSVGQTSSVNKQWTDNRGVNCSQPKTAWETGTNRAHLYIMTYINHCRRNDTQDLVQTATRITEGLIESRQTLASQLQRNEETMHVLGTEQCVINSKIFHPSTQLHRPTKSWVLIVKWKMFQLLWIHHANWSPNTVAEISLIVSWLL